ncbi:MULTISPECIES: SDR family oxidoreductase [Bradyrhizobium]|uniref:NAD(P)-binding domain-containing protein n=3 Tax=Bradyrhizobium TaxID=374 RepID=A0AAE5X978_9BRAD|nr:MULTISPECIES: NAD(P)H-binding protein [Bradyrhizobium]MCG2628207.1 NAD(P)H-binding protein [Bradyrhizobium zhengyangense]MCG2643326.1 NAD(P)H-binding protein [Bradyrhizobium zhengyangense]MCG2670360.1 NAD(P)H-binding protein [Bradyrhizobium zhengyangense]MDN4985905.1 NAD(P)H-binding protein [Bradyrhizobium sp. WYCCWR 13022]MDN5002716.1 NAD(P)H-binding protein [Bradyrhizobium sp. WYCCWR 12677]
MRHGQKKIPSTILIFGAAAHIGGPLAHFLREEAPQIKLRLVTSNPANCDVLRREHPHAEVVIASYFDLASLEKAVDGMEGIFVLTRSGTNEADAMTNLVVLLKKARSAVHVIRLVGLQPEANRRRIPQSLREHGLGLPIQHPIAKEILDESGLPVTYLNIGATFMDNFYWMKDGLRKERKLIWPERLIPYIDPRDIAEVAGRLFLSSNHRHIGQFHTLNNGQDILRFSDVADLMTKVFQERIVHDGSRAGFFEAYRELGEIRLHYLWDFFQYEEQNEVVWARNDFVERTLGRMPVSLSEWLAEHRQALLFGI